MTDGGIEANTLDALADAGQVPLPAQTAPAEPTVTPLKSGAQERRPPAEPVTPADLEQAIEAFSDVISTLNRGVRFQVDQGEGRLVAQVVDRNTNEVLRQIPPEEFLEMASRLRDFVGLLLDVEI